MESFRVSDLQIALATAAGFCQLELLKEAIAELDRLQASDSADSQVQLLRLRILVDLEKWHAAALLAETLVEKGYWDASVYLLGSHAIRYARTLDEAEAFLRRGEIHLQSEPHFHYFMACYACKRGTLNAAKAALELAFRLDPKLRSVALQDEDLRSLWRRPH